MVIFMTHVPGVHELRAEVVRVVLEVGVGVDRLGHPPKLRHERRQVLADHLQPCSIFTAHVTWVSSGSGWRLSTPRCMRNEPSEKAQRKSKQASSENENRVSRDNHAFGPRTLSS